MSNREAEVTNRIEKSAAQSGSSDSIDRLQLLKDGTKGGTTGAGPSDKAGIAGGGKENEPGGGGGWLEMTDPFKQKGNGSAAGENLQKPPSGEGKGEAKNDKKEQQLKQEEEKKRDQAEKHGGGGSRTGAESPANETTGRVTKPAHDKSEAGTAADGKGHAVAVPKQDNGTQQHKALSF